MTFNRQLSSSLLGLAALALLTSPGTHAAEVCGPYRVSPVVTYSGATLRGSLAFAESVDARWDQDPGRIRLAAAGTGNFAAPRTFVGPGYSTVGAACAADFDGDGLTDYAAVPNQQRKLAWYENTADTQPDVNWLDPTQYREASFVEHVVVDAGATPAGRFGHGGLACGDFTGDGLADLIWVYCESAAAGTYCDTVGTPDGVAPFSKYLMYVNNGLPSRFGAGAAFLGKNGAFQATPGFQLWKGSNTAVVDLDGDGDRDLIWGNVSNPVGDGGHIYRLYNQGGGAFKFGDNAIQYLVQKAFSGLAGAANAQPMFAGIETAPGSYFLFVGSPTSPALYQATGATGPLKCATTIAPGTCLNWGGKRNLAPPAWGITSLVTADFTGDGKRDLFVAADRAGCTALNLGVDCALTPRQAGYLYTNDGDADPFFTAGAPQIPAQKLDWATAGDVDAVLAMNYDDDPDGTQDLLVFADEPAYGQRLVVLPNRIAGYKPSGTATSVILPLDPFTGVPAEMSVTQLRLNPTVTLNGGTITWEGTNDGSTWVPAVACDVDGVTMQCVNFTTTMGNSVRWRATLNAPAGAAATPIVTSLDVGFSYVKGENQFLAGPIARDGLIYVGASRQPGSVGAFFAIFDDATGATAWEAGEKLDAMADGARNMYSANGTTRIDWAVGTGTTNQGRLVTLTGTATVAQAEAVVAWQRSARFGVTAIKHRMGSIEYSTPALLTPPAKPYWYNYTAAEPMRASIDAFIAAREGRPQLALIGSRDGALHAYRTTPAVPSDSANGTEAWAFVPQDVAPRMRVDAVTGVVTAHPDASPTLADAWDGSNWHTYLVSGEGAGGKAVYALRVTDTVTTTGVNGPTPLWSFTEANMGYTMSKPTIIRVKVGGATERWFAVFASGPGGGALDVGDTVYAVDLFTGALVWRFDIGDVGTYVATDITAAETDDSGETGSPTEDGYIDRLFFGDSKGRIWKLDPGTYNAVAKTITTVDSNVTVAGLPHKAFFTTLTAPPISGARAIAGTIAAAEDSTQRLVLYFATGGTPETPGLAQNAVFAINANDGAIRKTYVPAPGVKYYGGVSYNAGQVVFAGSVDGTGSCDTDASITILDALTFAVVTEIPLYSRIASPVYVQNGVVYTATLEGNVVSTTPPTGGSGGGGGGSTGGGLGGGGEINTTPMTILSWRLVTQ